MKVRAAQVYPHARAAVVFFNFQRANFYEEFHSDLATVAGAEVRYWRGGVAFNW